MDHGIDPVWRSSSIGPWEVFFSYSLHSLEGEVGGLNEVIVGVGVGVWALDCLVAEPTSLRRLLNGPCWLLKSSYLPICAILPTLCPSLSITTTQSALDKRAKWWVTRILVRHASGPETIHFSNMWWTTWASTAEKGSSRSTMEDWA